MSDMDILVCGGGITGAAFSLALAECGLQVSVVSDILPGKRSSTGRVYALSPASQRFLARLGVWSQLEKGRCEPIRAMHVFGDEQQSMISFLAQEYGVGELGWIVSEEDIQDALDMALDRSHILRVHGRVCSLNLMKRSVRAHFEDESSFETRLLVGADGGRSFVRNYAGFESQFKTYGHMAVTFNLKASIPHSGLARQWFEGGRVLALLPLPDNHLSVVWSMPKCEADSFLALSQNNQVDMIEKASFGVAGSLEAVTAACAFPLNLLSVPSPAMERVALIGDAAHVVHPLAGQGANLGLQDAEVLADVIICRGRHDPGERFLLNQYFRRRARVVRHMQKVTDGLQLLFSRRDPFSRWIRNYGLKRVDHVLWIKKRIMHLAMQGE